ncbi:DUF305 domain-containing protein [Nonomuraea jiangxiensis]|uniref:Uncharacterized conserved protein, DUF305 family n=1 Tax=Nonomuraea jiangxiensis TaxID=633440 RepID=A0A1G8ENF6_9ACTN|nr:DUF305 domain-containing protein [Nonomuraea jiangxiensis]SDH71411.1 Uncharacterized conserved protein, DUF305 family [Nonomuraea jiangxiensis]
MPTNRKMSTTVAAGALALLTACGGATTEQQGMSGGNATATTSAPATPAFNDADVRFAQMMIPHHEQAAQMADLAPSRAHDPEIKELAAKIKASQGQEIQTMKGWLAQWGKPVPSGGMGHEMPGMVSEKDMKQLAAAKGPRFDKLFTQRMIAHHKGAIEMARHEQADGSNPQARELAKSIESTQQAEVARLQKILARL